MSFDENQIRFYSEIAMDSWSVLIKRDYGHKAIDKLTFLTDSIINIYKHLNLSSFNRITIYTAINDDLLHENIVDAHWLLYQTYQNLTHLSGDELTIGVLENMDLMISIDSTPSVETLREQAIVYQKVKNDEFILGKDQIKKLKKIPNSESYFSVQTYKDLESAIEDYKIKVARHTGICPYLSTIWFDCNKIFFKPRPEIVMRNSLTYFLKIRLRSVTEVRPEQIVDETHPVDIKITWSYTSRIALIEIKWLGKSLEKLGEKFKQNYSSSRANEGAKQLAEYLDSNKVQAPDNVTKGYLVVFDGRRWQTNSNTKEINSVNGFYYQNSEIDYNPDYSKIRNDFAKPIRLFMEAKCTI